MSWTTHGVDRLWMSPLSRHGQAEALRGGVPVLFPQFGTFGDLPKHGFARTADWEPVRAQPERGQAALSFQLTDSEETRAVWPHAFRARLDISASPTALIMSLTVVNRGQDVARFTGGLHTYLAVADPEAWIDGLAGCHVWDGVSTQSPRFTEHITGPIRALDAQDLVIHGALAPVVLNDAVLGSLHVAAEGFSNRVVWNPGPGHSLPDVAPGDEARFVCIEPTAVVPVVLPGGGVWQASQRLYLG
jgi:glucose-6-phosphate 1-epimerase